MTQSPQDLDALMAQAERTTSQTPSWMRALAASGAPAGAPTIPATPESAEAAGGIGIGALKGGGRTIVGAFKLMRDVANEAGANIDADERLKTLLASSALSPTDDAQKLGMTGEQLAEFFLLPQGKVKATGLLVPYLGKLLGRYAPVMASQGAMAGTLSAVHGESPWSTGAVAAAMPVMGGTVNAVADWVGSRAVPLARSAIKPTVSAIRGEQGFAEGLNTAATRIARYIIDRGIMSSANATAIVREQEQLVRQAIAQAGDPVTQAPQLAEQYLRALADKVKKADQPGLNAIINREIKILYRPGGQMSETIPVLDPMTGLPQVDAMGNAVTQQVLRTDVTASEARQIATASSRYVTRDTWGEKGQEIHAKAAKAKESGVRASVRDAVPGVVAPLKEEGRALAAKGVLDRMEFRMGNRDTIGLAPQIILGGGSSKSAVIAFATQLWNRGQLRAGVYADRLSKAIKGGDAQTVGAILGRLGVAIPGDGTPEVMTPQTVSPVVDAIRTPGTIRAMAPDGSIHEAPAGTPLPAGWVEK